tara:strand:+ start:1219 stop:1515 length:297 start_codon:yes stop_codon:yes gene_type:complete
MSFESKSASEAGKWSKRGPIKKELPLINEKMERLYEKVLDDLHTNKDKSTKTKRVKVFVTFYNYIFPKTKSILYNIVTYVQKFGIYSSGTLNFQCIIA